MSDCLALDRHVERLISGVEEVARDQELALPRINDVTLHLSNEGAVSSLALWNFADGGGAAEDTPWVPLEANRYDFGGAVENAHERAVTFLAERKPTLKEHKLKLKAEPHLGGFPLQVLWLEAAWQSEELEKRLRARYATWSGVYISWSPSANDIANADLKTLQKRVRNKLKPLAAVPGLVGEVAAFLFATEARRQWLIDLASAPDVTPAQLQQQIVARIQELARQGANTMNLDDVTEDDVEDAADDWWHHMGQEDCAQEFDGDSDAKKVLRTLKLSQLYRTELAAALRVRLKQA